MGFRGVINVILRKQIEMSRSFSLFQPPHPTTTRYSRAICFLNSSLFFLMHRLLPFPKKKNFGKKKVTLDLEPSTLDPRPSTLDPRPSTLDKKIDSTKTSNFASTSAEIL